jgi:hypothetical protein
MVSIWVCWAETLLPPQTRLVFHDRNYKKSSLHLPSLSDYTAWTRQLAQVPDDLDRAQTRLLGQNYCLQPENFYLVIKEYTELSCQLHPTETISSIPKQQHRTHISSSNAGVGKCTSFGIWRNLEHQLKLEPAPVLNYK